MVFLIEVLNLQWLGLFRSIREIIFGLHSAPGFIDSVELLIFGNTFGLAMIWLSRESLSRRKLAFTLWRRQSDMEIDH